MDISCDIAVFILHILWGRRITLAARSKARNVFARSNTGIVDSNPTLDMDVYLSLYCVRVM
jgi:hypothetical protein